MKKKIFLIIVLLLLIALSVFALGRFKSNDTIDDAPIIEDPVNEVVKESPSYIKELKERYETNLKVSDDYMGEIHFESGLISLPFVYSGDNTTYYRTNWIDMSHDEEGSIFMDEDCSLDSQNIVLYGHYVYKSYEASGTHKFTPLSKLLEAGEYNDNKTICLYLGNEYRIYEIAAVYYCDLVYIDGNYYPNENLVYYLPEYDDEYFAIYKENILKASFYDTGVEFDNEDNFLTLQTCVENHDNLREIVVAKEIERVEVK